MLPVISTLFHQYFFGSQALRVNAQAGAQEHAGKWYPTESIRSPMQGCLLSA
jgi:hypothetical protein